MVMVLGKGHQLFYGSPDAAEEWFTGGLGLALPPKTSPSDFIMCVRVLGRCWVGMVGVVSSLRP